MSFDVDGFYTGKYAGVVKLKQYNNMSVYMPVGYTLHHNTIIQKGDLFFDTINLSWSKIESSDCGKYITYLARKTKIINKIFIDL